MPPLLLPPNLLLPDALFNWGQHWDGLGGMRLACTEDSQLAALQTCMFDKTRKKHSLRLGNAALKGNILSQSVLISITRENVSLRFGQCVKTLKTS